MATEGAEGDLDTYGVGGWIEAVEGEGELKQSRAEQSTSEQSIAERRRAHLGGEEAGNQVGAAALGGGNLGAKAAQEALSRSNRATRGGNGPDNRGADVARRWSGRPIQMTRRRRCRRAVPLGGRATRGDSGPDPDDPAKELQTGGNGPGNGGAEIR